jgi:serine protease Do
MPAVVNISSSKIVRSDRGPFFNDPFFRFFFEGPGAATRRERSLGSGVIVSSDGHVLTNNHVVENAQEIRVALGDRREFRARLIGTDPKTDLAVLRLPGSGFPVLRMGDSDRVEVAEPVLAVGNPFGLGQTVTIGIVSALGRANVGIADYEDFIQTDAAINPGNSGGALVNGRAELIGINSAIFSQSGGYQGIGFAVPINMARTVMDQILKTGRVTRGTIGVTVQEISGALARGLGLADSRGVVVSDLVLTGPAARAGLVRGDVILRVGDRPVDDAGHFRNSVAILPVGSTVRLTLRKAAGEHTVDVPVIEQFERPERRVTRDPDAARNDPLGMSITELTPDIARRLGLRSVTTGVVVAELAPGGLAQEAGLRPGDVIQEVNRQPIRNSRDLRSAFDAARGKDLVLLVYRAGQTAYLVIDRS